MHDIVIYMLLNNLVVDLIPLLVSTEHKYLNNHIIKISVIYACSKITGSVHSTTVVVLH